MFRFRINFLAAIVLFCCLAGSATAQLLRTGDGLTGHIEMLGGAAIPIAAYADATTGGGAQTGIYIGPQVNFKLRRVRNLLISAHGAYQQNNTQFNITGLTADSWKIFWLLAGVTWQYPINDDETATFEIGFLIGPAFVSTPTLAGPGGTIPSSNVTGFGSNLNLAVRFALSEKFTLKLGAALQSTRAQYTARASNGITSSIDQPMGTINIFSGIGYRLQSK